MEKTKLSNGCFRNSMLKSIISDDIGQVNEVDEGTLIYSYSKKLEQLKESNDFGYAIYQSIITVAFLDAYKILNSKLRDSSISYLELTLYNKIRKVTCIEDLEELIENDIFLLEELLKYSLAFLRMNEFQKIISIKKMDNNLKYYLKVSFPLFVNDVEEYGYEKDIPIELMTNYYTEEMNKAESNEKIDPYEKSNELFEQVEGFIKNIMGNDYANFISLMEEIITMDYKWSKYVVDKKYKSDAFETEELLERIEMYEDFSMQELVDEASTDSYYFEKLVDSMLLIKAYNMYFDEEVLNEEIVEEYFEKLIAKKRKNNVIIYKKGDLNGKIRIRKFD